MKKLAMLFLLALLPVGAQTVPNTANITAQDSGTCATAGACLTINVTTSAASTVVQVTGTFSATLQFEGTTSAGGTFVSVNAVPVGGSTAVTSTTSTGAWRIAVAGLSQVRVRCSTFSSGPAVVAMTLSTGSSANNTSSAGGAVSSVFTRTGAVTAQSGDYVCSQITNCPPGNNTWFVAQNCQGYTYCTQVNADGQYVVDATTTSGSSTVTCPNNDCNFVAGDVGKTVWATTTGSGAGSGLYAYTTYACPVTTIATVNSAQSITLTAANDCTQSLTASAVLIWGHKDGAALATMSTTIGCQPINWTQGLTLIDRPILNTVPTSSSTIPCNRALSASLGPPNIGPLQGASGTIWVITPDFNWSTCPSETGSQQPVCLGWAVGVARNFSIWGTGLTSATNANCPTNKIVYDSSEIFAVEMMGVCPGASGVEGFEIDSIDASLEDSGSISVGQYACVAYGGTAMFSRNNDCRNDNVSTGFGLWVTSNAQLNDFSSFPLINVKIDGTLNSRGAHFSGNTGATQAVIVDSGGVWLTSGDYVNIDSALPNGGIGLSIASGGIAQAQNTQFKSSSNPIVNSGNFIDLGGNSVPAGEVIAGPGAWEGAQVLAGSCTGTATSSATLGLYGLGEQTLATCTSTTVNLGKVIGATVTNTLVALRVTSTHAGVSASSGVVTVLDNGAATALTCTIGTGTSCRDTTHTVTYSPGDIISIQFTTQGSEVLAGVQATLLYW